MKAPMFEEFQNYIQDNRLFKPEDRILMAVSGGIDSMVMSHLLLRQRVNAGVAHCNFCLRGTDSDLDEEFVRKFAEENKLPFYSIRFETKKHAASKGISIQMAARELRYDWFEKVRKENKFDTVAVAHNLNDNIETLLVNLTRGTGLTGLTGMKPSSEGIIRPVLFASRTKIADYCVRYNISYREDKSNAETGYVRNKIRHKVIPVLMEINPSIESTLNETAERLGHIDKIFTDYIDTTRKRITGRRGSTVIFSIEKLLKFKPGEAILFEIFSPFGITAATSRDLERMLGGETGKRIFTKTHLIIRNRNEILVSPLENYSKIYYKIYSPEDLMEVPGISSVKTFHREADFIIPGNSNTACIDFDKVKFPLVVRNWQEGDIFYPLGMNHRKKLSDFFIDNKYPIPEKDEVPILESDGKIVWIMGKRLDNRFKITKSTTKILLIRISHGQS